MHILYLRLLLPTNLLFFSPVPYFVTSSLSRTLLPLRLSLSSLSKAPFAEEVNLSPDLTTPRENFAIMEQSKTFISAKRDAENYFVSHYEHGITGAAFKSQDRTRIGALIEDKIDTLANP